MKRLIIFVLLVMGIWSTAITAVTLAQQEPQQPFLPYYWVRGTVTNADGTAAAEKVVSFYTSWESWQRVTDETDANGYYEINVYELNYYYGAAIDFSTTYTVGVPQDATGYGAEQSFSLNPDQGYVDLNLALAEGQGPVEGEVPPEEAPPEAEGVTELSIVTESLEDGTVGQDYSVALQAEGGTAPYTWSIGEGYDILPDGLSLASETGAISGTPADGSQGEYEILFEVSDAAEGSASKVLTIEVSSVQVGGPQIYLKLFLEGLYNNNDGTQTSTSVIAEIYQGAGPANATAVLDPLSAPYVSGAIDLDENGEGHNGVVDGNGAETLPADDYYLVIKQKLTGVATAGANHLPIIANTTVHLADDTDTYLDLTDSAAANYVEAYTPAGSVDAMKTLNNGNFALRAGNLNNDNAINVLDYAVWKGEVTVDGAVDPADENSIISDINGDDKINIVDYSFWRGTVSDFAPGNVPQTGDHIYIP